MIQKFMFFTVGLLIVLGLSNLAQTKSPQAMETIDHPVVLELFTSQGCPACPAADKVLSEFVKNDNVIGLSCNVTYWDRPHWKNSLSKQFCDIRQMEYIAALNSDRVFTPQLLINGYFATVGSKTNRIYELIDKAPRIKNIDVSLNNSHAKFALPTLPEAKYDILLVPYGENNTQNTPNSGRPVTYINPVIDIVNLGKWTGKARDFNYDLSRFNNIKGVAVFIHQGHEYGEIAAAGKTEL